MADLDSLSTQFLDQLLASFGPKDIGLDQDGTMEVSLPFIVFVPWAP